MFYPVCTIIGVLVYVDNSLKPNQSTGDLENAPSVKSHWCIYNRRLFICCLYIPDSLGLMTDHHESVSFPGNHLRFDYPPLTFSVIPGQRWSTGYRTFQ